MTEYLYFQSLVQYRIPLVEGKLGTPEVTSKFTTEVKGSHKKAKSPRKELSIQEIETEEI